ncbi:HD domain-containing protein [Acidisphaera sp. S103]|uniref:HD domain-containing protein n=1 Tax=Acidisphaera sp. S103 TaxID=1747223 RepID=UPI00131B7BEA|nr:HD domain-containing protein [Acidisphaera sp. S103]
MGAIAAIFGDQAELAERLLAVLGTEGDDGSHDRSHLLRVWQNAASIAEQESGCDRTVLTAAVILHDCVAVEKNSPQRAMASRLAAARARVVLADMGWDTERIDAAAHAIEAHSFSAGIAPETVEARIVQDADRLDAIGAIGIARCFYVAGRMGSGLYNPDDPQAVHRDLDDRHFALDHFGAKLFRVAGNFQTKAGQALADARTRTMRDFVAALLDEIDGGNK